MVCCCDIGRPTHDASVRKARIGVSGSRHCIVPVAAVREVNPCAEKYNAAARIRKQLLSILHHYARRGVVTLSAKIRGIGGGGGGPRVWGKKHSTRLAA